MSSLKYRKLLGPSQMATVLDLNEYQTSDELKWEIEEGYEVIENEAIKLGIKREPIAIYFYQKLYNVTIVKPVFMMDPKNLRIGGICDGLIGDDTGFEVKCHQGNQPLQTLPLSYIIQMTAYMYLYQRSKWILMSCTFDHAHHLKKYKIFQLNWNTVKDQWFNDWYPKISEFSNSVKWVE